MSEDRDHDPAGWFNFCARRLPNGSFCGLRYWLAWVPSAGSGRRFIDRDSAEPHVCREVAQCAHSDDGDLGCSACGFWDCPCDSHVGALALACPNLPGGNR